MSEYRGRGRGGMRSRGGPLRGSMRGRGGYGDRDSGRGFSRGRGGFSRGRGGPVRHISREDHDHSPPPPRKVPMMSRGYESDRGRGPPISRRVDRYEDSYERGPPPRSRDSYPSPPRESSRLIDRLSPPPSRSFRDRDYPLSSSREHPSSRGDYLPHPRSYSPPPRDSGGFRESFREERRDSFSRSGPRDYGSSRMSGDYGLERSRDFRESPRDYGSSRDYPPPRSEFRDSLNSREFRERPHPRDYENGREHHPRSYDRAERDYGSSRSFSSRLDDRPPPRGPPREYRGRGGFRGSFRGRDDRGGRFMSGGRGRGPPRGRGRPDFAGSRGRRSPPMSRDAPPRKLARMEGGDGYSSRR